MKKEKLEVKAGFSKGEQAPSRDEVEKAGYEFKETESKIYAIDEVEAEIPESIDELINLVGREDALKYALSTFKVREYFDPARHAMKSLLNKEVPKAVKDYLKALKQQAKLSFTPFDVEDIETIPFTAKQSTDSVDNYLEQVVG